MEEEFDRTLASGSAEVLESPSLDSEADAYEFLEQLRWGADGPTRCPHCGSGKGAWFLKPKDPNGRLAKGGSTSRSHRRVWKCRENSCRRQFSALTNTVMHATKMPVRAWVGAVIDLCQSQNGVSAREIATRWDVTEKSAWAMLTRIEEAITGAQVDGENPLSAAVRWLEVPDESGSEAAKSEPEPVVPAIAAAPERPRIAPVVTPARPAEPDHSAAARPSERVAPRLSVEAEQHSNDQESGAVETPVVGSTTSVETPVVGSTTPVETAATRSNTPAIDRSPGTDQAVVEGSAERGLAPPKVDGEQPAVAHSRPAERVPRQESTAPQEPQASQQPLDTASKSVDESAAAQVKSDVERALAEAFAEPAAPQNGRPDAAVPAAKGGQNTGARAPEQARERPTPPAAKAAGWSEKPNKRREPRPEKPPREVAPAGTTSNEQGPSKKSKKSKNKARPEHQTPGSERGSGGSTRADSGGSKPVEVAAADGSSSLVGADPARSKKSKKSKKKARTEHQKPGSERGSGGSTRADSGGSEPVEVAAADGSSSAVAAERGRSKKSKKLKNRARPEHQKPGSERGSGGSTRADSDGSEPALEGDSGGSERADSDGSEPAKVSRSSSLLVQPPGQRGWSEKSNRKPNPEHMKPGSERADSGGSEPSKTVRSRSLSVQPPGQRGWSEKPKKGSVSTPAARGSGETQDRQPRDPDDNQTPGATAPNVPQPVDNLPDAQAESTIQRHHERQANPSTSGPSESALEATTSQQTTTDEFGGGWLDMAAPSPLDTGHALSKEQGQLSGIEGGALGPSWADVLDKKNPATAAVAPNPPDQLELFSGGPEHGA